MNLWFMVSYDIFVVFFLMSRKIVILHRGTQFVKNFRLGLKRPWVPSTSVTGHGIVAMYQNTNES